MRLSYNPILAKEKGIGLIVRITAVEASFPVQVENRQVELVLHRCFQSQYVL
jgi:hypothetical protein